MDLIFMECRLDGVIIAVMFSLNQGNILNASVQTLATTTSNNIVTGPTFFPLLVALFTQTMLGETLAH